MKAKTKKKPEALGTPAPPAAAADSTADPPCSPSETQPPAAGAPLPPAQVVGNAFVRHYYKVLHQSPELVYRFFQDASRLGRPAKPGAEMDVVTTMEAINQKIMSMDVARAEIRAVDVQESLGGGVTVLVMGHLTRRTGVSREFVQSFFLAPQEKGYFVLNDILRYAGEEEDAAAQPPAPEVAAPALPHGTAAVPTEQGQTGYDVEKALDILLDISGLSSSRDNEIHNTNGSNAERNGTLCPNIFLRNGLSMGNIAADDNRSLFQLADQISSMALQSEVEHDFLWGEPQTSYAQAVMAAPHSATLPSRPTESKANSQQVLESLFKVPEIRTYEPSSMDWKRVVKKLQSFNSPIESNNQERPKKGDGYREFRGIAAQHYDRMKQYYQQAALAYSKGDKSYASYLAEEAKHYRELARLEDEKASREIFEARNKHITNTVTIDLHGQHVKQAMKLLKVHMMICVCMPSVLLRVITGCGSEGTGKGKIKRSVIELAEKEHIEWHEENHGTIVLRLGGPREYGFSEHDSDTD